jgi:hypothetical protein
MVAFKPSSAALEFDAQSDVEFVLGSAVPHDFHLVLGSHSVHTSIEALKQAELLANQARQTEAGLQAHRQAYR